jgi:glycerol-3-phosphate dehydrogenase subunit B
VTRTVIVIGAGAAGVAAAWSARREGAAVTLVSRGSGASSLSGGAVDDVPWERLARAASELGVDLPVAEVAEDVLSFSRALGLWALPETHTSRSRLATIAGRIRPARGHDRALLDLARLQGARVLLPRVDRAIWDADAIAAALSDEPFARASGLRFAAADVPILRFDEERRIADGDLAARHDDEARLEWLAARLREGIADARRRGEEAGAVLLGPWLGARAPRAEALSELAGVPVGEALMGAGSPAGLRFDASRDRLLDAEGVRVVRDRATAIARTGGRASVSLERSAAPLTADAVVLAIGGVAGGGVVYAPPESLAEDDLPARVSVPFTLSLTADVTLAAWSGALEVMSSLHGPELDLCAWPQGERPGALEAAGVLCTGVRAAPPLGPLSDALRIAAAGDVIARRPRTLLEAVASGIRAGRER